MKKNIFTQDWMSMHPYPKADDVDIYYTNLANKIYTALDNACFTHEFKNTQDAKYLALCIAGYFEDVISGTGIWKAFTTECKRRYGVYIPFYLEGAAANNSLAHEGDGLVPEYDQDEINLADVKFLLWHHFQQSIIGQSVQPPLFGTMEIASKMVYDVLNAEYETAPENERMHEFLCDMPVNGDEFYKFWNILEWFHYGCYFNVGNRKRLFYGMQWLAHSGNFNEPNAYTFRVEQMLDRHENLLSLSSLEWIAKISEANPAHKLWCETDCRSNHVYAVERDDEHFYYAKDLIQKDTIKVSKASTVIDDYEPLTKGEQLLAINNLVKFGDTWWQVGPSRSVNNDKPTQKAIREQRDIINHKQTIKDYNLLKDNGYGSRFIFAESFADVKEFLESIGYDKLKNAHFQKPAEEGIIIYGSPYTGINLAINIAQCISSPDNPFYDAEKAADRSFDIICGRGDAFPYEIVCSLIAGHMLPDANMFTSKYAKALGKQVTQENLLFLADYYLKGRLDKDVSPAELW